VGCGRLGSCAGTGPPHRWPAPLTDSLARINALIYSAGLEIEHRPANAGDDPRLSDGARVRRLLSAPDAAAAVNSRVRPTIVNDCGVNLKGVKLTYTTTYGSTRQVHFGRVSLKPGGRRGITVRAAWPSTGKITGSVQDGGEFELSFIVSDNGTLTWDSGVASVSSSGGGAGALSAAEAHVTGGACAPSPLSSSQTMQQALKLASAETSSGSSSSSSQGGPSAQVRAAAITPDALAVSGALFPNADLQPNLLIANPDFAITYMETPVDIYILRNDIIPNPASTTLRLFNTGDPRGTVLLTSPATADGVDTFTSGDGATWSWTSDPSDDPVIGDFRLKSYLTYTPPKNVLGGTVVFNYTVGALMRGVAGSQ